MESGFKTKAEWQEVYLTRNLFIIEENEVRW